MAYWGQALSGFRYASYLTYVELANPDAVYIWSLASPGRLRVGLITSSAVLIAGPATREAADD